MKKKRYALVTIILLVFTRNLFAQSQFSLTPGFFYNGTTFGEDVSGFGAILGLEYRSKEDHFFSLELRTTYGYFSFDDGTKWKEDVEGILNPPVNNEPPRLEYSLFSPQVGLVPKFYYPLDETFSLFLENEFSVGLMSGRFRYKGLAHKKSFTEPLFSYHIGAGIEYKLNNCTLVGSLGYTTLNFRGKIKKHQPAKYQEYIPDQNPGLWMNVLVKIPLSKRNSN